MIITPKTPSDFTEGSGLFSLVFFGQSFTGERPHPQNTTSATSATSTTGTTTTGVSVDLATHLGILRGDCHGGQNISHSMTIVKVWWGGGPIVRGGLSQSEKIGAISGDSLAFPPQSTAALWAGHFC
jgi:hypothetical protein